MKKYVAIGISKHMRVALASTGQKVQSFDGLQTLLSKYNEENTQFCFFLYSLTKQFKLTFDGNILRSYSLEFSITLCTSREKIMIAKFEQNNGV